MHSCTSQVQTAQDIVFNLFQGLNPTCLVLKSSDNFHSWNRDMAETMILQGCDHQGHP